MLSSAFVRITTLKIILFLVVAAFPSPATAMQDTPLPYDLETWSRKVLAEMKTFDRFNADDRLPVIHELLQEGEALASYSRDVDPTAYAAWRRDVAGFTTWFARHMPSGHALSVKGDELYGKAIAATQRLETFSELDLTALRYARFVNAVEHLNFDAAAGMMDTFLSSVDRWQASKNFFLKTQPYRARHLATSVLMYHGHQAEAAKQCSRSPDPRRRGTERDILELSGLKYILGRNNPEAAGKAIYIQLTLRDSGLVDTAQLAHSSAPKNVTAQAMKLVKLGCFKGRVLAKTYQPGQPSMLAWYVQVGL